MTARGRKAEPLVSVIERQAGEVRGLAQAVRAWAEEHHQLSNGKLRTIGSWADTLDGIAIELIEAVADGKPNGSKLKALGLTIAGALTVTASIAGIAADGAQVVDRWTMPDPLRERIERIESGLDETNELLKPLAKQDSAYSFERGAELGRLVGVGVYDPDDFEIVVDERKIAAFDKRSGSSSPSASLTLPSDVDPAVVDWWAVKAGFESCARS